MMVRPESNGAEAENRSDESLAKDEIEPRIGASFGTIEDEPLQSFDEIIAEPGGRTAGEGTNPPAPRRKRRGLKVLLVAIGLVVLVAGGFGVNYALDAHNAQIAQEEQQKQVQEREAKKAEAIREADNPFSVLVGQVDPPSASPVESQVDGGQLKAGGTTLTLKDSKLTAPVNGCVVEDGTDICLAAQGTVADSDVSIFLVKDISRTRFLENPLSFQELKKSGSTIAASMEIDMGDGESPTPVGALTASGTTGFILIFPSETSASKVEEVLQAATVV